MRTRNSAAARPKLLQLLSDRGLCRITSRHFFIDVSNMSLTNLADFMDVVTGYTTGHTAGDNNDYHDS